MRWAVEDLDPRQLRRERVGDLAGAVRRVVVEHEDAVTVGVELLAEGPHHRLEVLALVVRRQADRPARIGPILPVLPGPMIGTWSRPCPGTAISQTGSTCSPTSRRSSASSPSGSPPTVAPPRGSATPLRPSPSSRSSGRATELPDIGKTIEAKIVEVVETGDMEALAKRRDGGSRRGGRVHAAAGPRARRRRRASGGSSASRRSPELKAAAEGQQLRTLAGMGPTTEAKVLKALADGQGPDEPQPRPPRQGASRRPRGGRGAACPPGRDRRLGGGQHAPAPRDVPRPRRDRDRHRPRRADGAFRRPAVGARGRGARRHEGDRDHQAGPPARSPRRAAGELRRPAAALHRLEGPQRRAARAGAARRALGLRVRRHGRRDRRGTYLRGRGVALRLPRLQLHPARAARERRRARGGAAGNAPTARRARRPPRRDALPLDVVLGRQGDDRGDGPHRGRPRLRVPLPHRPLALPPRGRLEQQWREIDERQRAGCALPRAAGRRGEHHGARDRGRPGRDAGRARLGRGLAPHLARPRARPSACSPRSTTRTSTASGT